MCKNDVFGPKLCVESLVKNIKNPKIKKSLNSNKQLVGRYNILHKIL